MKPKTVNRKAELLERFASGECVLAELEAVQLGIDLSGIHFSIKGFENKGCLPPVQIDELIIPGEEGIFAPCVGSFFYTPYPDSIIILAGNKTPDPDLLQNAPRKPSEMAYLSVMDKIGYRSPKGEGPAEQESYTLKLESEIISKRNHLNTIS